MQDSVVRAVRGELAHYPGVDMELKNGGKHIRAVFFKDGNSRFLTLPVSASDWRAGKNALRDMRTTMRELGAQRMDILNNQRKGRRTLKAPAGMSLNKTAMTIYFSAHSPLLSRFKTPDGKAAGVWQVEFRASPDLAAPPLLVIKKAKLPPGKEKAPGYVKGNLQPATGGWSLMMSRGTVPVLTNLVDLIKPVDLQLVSQNDHEVVLKLPTGVIPTGYTIKAKAGGTLPVDPPAPQLETLDAPDTLELDQQLLDGTTAKAKEPGGGLADRPMVLQFPRQPVSVEQAIAVLNKAKDRLGSNLRFTITEGGRLTATHRIGY